MTRHGVRSSWMRYRWVLLAVLAVLGLVLGFIGLERWADIHDRNPSFFDVLYDDLTLLRLDAFPRESPVPWTLQIARFLLPAVLIVGAISGLVVLFRDRFQQARLPFLRNHVVVAGLGVKGLAFAKAMRSENATVVVVERDAGNMNLAWAREAGAIAIVGDAADRDILDLAGVGRARCLLATADDGTNAEIVMQAQELNRDRSGSTLACLAHVVDPELCTLLKSQALMGLTADGFRVDFFNFYAHAARVVCTMTLTPDARVVVIGAGPLGEQIILRAAEDHARARRHALDVTIVAHGADERSTAVQARHPQLATTATLRPFELTGDIAFMHGPLVLPPDSGPAVVYICDLDDGTAVEIALDLKTAARDADSRIVVCTSQADGLASILTTSTASSLDTVIVVALARDTCTSDLVNQGIYELLGRAIHEDYVWSRHAEGTLVPDDPSLASWEQLPETLRESNRSQAEHIGLKLREVGCDLVPVRSAPTTFEFEDAEVELLGRMEHDRWVSERRADGWRPGAQRDPIARTTPYLVDWEQLSDDIRDRDRETVQRLPETVGRAGFQIVRSHPPASVDATS